MLDYIQGYSDQLSSCIGDIEKSKLEKGISEEKEILKSIFHEAETLYKNSDGKVLNDNLRIEMKGNMDKADSLLSGSDVSEKSLTDLKELNTKLRGSLNSVKKSMSDYKDEERRKEEYSSTSESKEGFNVKGTDGNIKSSSNGNFQYNKNSGSSQSQSPDKNDVWNVSYTVAYHSYDLGSGLVKWEDGYFVAHNTNSFGKMILSRPKRVRVDGVEYRYVSERVVSSDTLWADVQSFVQSNNGIGFQTCVDSSGLRYLITHYEPV